MHNIYRTNFIRLFLAILFFAQVTMGYASDEEGTGSPHMTAASGTEGEPFILKPFQKKNLPVINVDALLRAQVVRLQKTIENKFIAQCFLDSAENVIENQPKFQWDLQASSDMLYFMSKLTRPLMPDMLPLLMDSSQGSPSIMHMKTFLDYMPAQCREDSSDKLLELVNCFERAPKSPIAPKFFGLPGAVTSDSCYEYFTQAYELVMTPRTDIKAQSWQHFRQIIRDLHEGMTLKELPRAFKLTQPKPHLAMIQTANRTARVMFLSHIAQYRDQEQMILDKLVRLMGVTQYPDPFFNVFNALWRYMHPHPKSEMVPLSMEDIMHIGIHYDHLFAAQGPLALVREMIVISNPELLMFFAKGRDGRDRDILFLNQ